MTYYGGHELAAAFRTVRNNTIKIAEEIPEDKYEFRASPDTRSVAQMLAHIAVSVQFQTYVHVNKITDLKTVNFMELFPKFMAEETKPRTKAELIAPSANRSRSRLGIRNATLKASVANPAPNRFAITCSRIRPSTRDSSVADPTVPALRATLRSSFTRVRPTGLVGQRGAC